MLTMSVDSVVQVPVTVITLRWNGGLKGSGLGAFPCSACRKPLGNKAWALAWIRDHEGKERGARLCESCAKKAEADVIQRDIDED